MGSHVTCQLSVTRITPLPQGEGLFHNYPPLKDSLHSVESIFPSNTNYIQTKRAKLDSRHVFCKLAKKCQIDLALWGVFALTFIGRAVAISKDTHTQILKLGMASTVPLLVLLAPMVAMCQLSKSKMKSVFPTILRVAFYGFIHKFFQERALKYQVFKIINI